MLSPAEARRVLAEAEQVCSAAAVEAALRRVAQEINARLSQANPLVLAVMGGAVVFAGQLLPLLRFPLDFDYIHVSRYDEATSGGTIRWKVEPNARVAGRSVLVLDDILDQGDTLAAIRDKVLAQGAGAFFSAVLADKDLGREKPIRADFTGLVIPNRYVFGFGMDVHGAWRNLPAIYALKSEK